MSTRSQSPPHRMSRGRRAITLGVTGVLAVAFALISPGIAAADQYRNGFWIYGSIDREFRSLGFLFPGGPPTIGEPNSAELPAARGGRWQAFGADTNRIYWSPEVDPNQGRQVGGLIMSKWLNSGDERGFLGYPVTREQAANGGRYNHFQGGSVYWSLSSGARVIHGAIRDAWAAAGWENSYYGFPTSDEYTQSNGVIRQNFQNGMIEFQPGVGIVESRASTFRYTTFIPSASVEAPCSSYGAISEKYKGDNRGFSADSNAYRTRVDVNVYTHPNRNGGPQARLTKTVHPTERTLTYYESAPYTDPVTGETYPPPKTITETMTASDQQITMTPIARNGTDFRDVTRFQINHEAAQPFCDLRQVFGAIKYDIAVGFSGVKNQFSVSGSYRQMPNHEAYIRNWANPNSSWTTVLQKELVSAACLSPLTPSALCPPGNAAAQSSGWNGGR